LNKYTTTHYILPNRFPTRLFVSFGPSWPLTADEENTRPCFGLIEKG